MPWVSRPFPCGLKGRESASGCTKPNIRALAAFQAARLLCSPSQGIGLRPQPWAKLSRPVGPVLPGTLNAGLEPAPQKKTTKDVKDDKDGKDKKLPDQLSRIRPCCPCR